jgi:hypothetical protein
LGADVIAQKKINGFNGVEQEDLKIKRVYPGKLTEDPDAIPEPLKEISYSQAEKMLFEERQFFSGNPIINSEIAEELFSDAPQGEAKARGSYTFHYYMLIPIEGQLYQFELLNTPSSKCLFTKLEIANKSKDVFTNKSNYSVKLTINFTGFEDLITNSVRVVSRALIEENKKNPNIEIPNSNINNFAMINLLYKNRNKLIEKTLELAYSFGKKIK